MLNYRNIRNNRRNQKVKGIYYILLLVSFIISFIIPVLLQSDFNGINNTIGKIYFPNGFIYKDFNSTSPWIKYSFFIQNGHTLTISDLEVRIIIISDYIEENCTTRTRRTIFQREDIFTLIEPSDYIYPEINATEEWFDLNQLNMFWSQVNLSTCYSFLINFEVNVRYIWSLSRFNVIAYGIDINLYKDPLE